MKVVLPINEGKVALLRDENGYFRPAMGKTDAGSIAEHLFGMHGFSDHIGSVQLSGELVEFYILQVKQIIESTKKSDAPFIEVPMEELQRAVHTEGVSLNIFLNLAIRMYEDLVA